MGTKQRIDAAALFVILALLSWASVSILASALTWARIVAALDSPAAAFGALLALIAVCYVTRGGAAG